MSESNTVDIDTSYEEYDEEDENEEEHHHEINDEDLYLGNAFEGFEEKIKKMK